MSKYTFKINGQYVTQEEFGNYKPGGELPRRAPPPARGTNDWKQLSCETMGWDGNVEDAKRLDREYGAPYVDYVQVGPNSYNPVFNDRSTYNKWLKAHGWFNRTSGKSGANPIDGTMLQRAAARMLEKYDSGNLDTPAVKLQ